MTILVEFQIAAKQFKPGEFVAGQGLRAELERIVPTEDHAIPYVWVTGPPQTLEEVTETLKQSNTISTMSTLDRLNDTDSDETHQLYRIEWVLDELDIVNGILAAEGVIMEGESIDDSWLLRLRFPSHDHVAGFYQYLADHNITEFTIHSISELQTRPDRGGTYDLTPNQREALTLAAGQGYFDTPRDVTLEELGDQLGISEQAVSQRIRRANRKVIFAALNEPGSSD